MVRLASVSREDGTVTFFDDQETKKGTATFVRALQPHETGEDIDFPVCELRAFG